jgi:hypothetical protein
MSFNREDGSARPGSIARPFKRQLRAAIHMADSLGYIRIDTICEWVDADAR